MKWTNYSIDMKFMQDHQTGQGSYRTNLAKGIVDKFTKAKELAKDESVVKISSDSRSILVPLILMGPVFYYFGGTENLFMYGKFLVINIISAHIAFLSFIVIESYFNRNSNASDNEIFLERIHILEEYFIAWHSSNESRFIRFGLFIAFLLGGYLFIWYSIFLNKPIEYCIYKYSKFNLTLDPNLITEIENEEKKSIKDLTKKDLVKLKSDGSVDKWTEFSRNKIDVFYKEIQEDFPNLSDTKQREKTSEKFYLEYGHLIDDAPGPVTIYRWYNY